jgi:hypothetical protein
MAKRDYAAEWDPAQRYRIFRVVEGEPLEIASTNTSQGVGLCLVTLWEEGQWSEKEAVGVLDSANWEKGKPGSWIINPYARGGK